MPAHLLAIDQGTTSTRALIFAESGEVLASEALPHQQFYPADGRVEHDAEEIWRNSLTVIRRAIGKAAGANLVAAGITNQRETTVLWDRATGVPLAPAIVWQDRRTAAVCEALRSAGHEPMIQDRTGLLIDPYFSGTKLAWLLDHVPGARARAEAGELAFGTIDSWLIWKLTNGRVHATDATNASRTFLYNIRTNDWDTEILRLLNIPRRLLPEVRDSAADYGLIDPAHCGTALPIRGVAGDQQAAAFGQACFEPGMVKSTYGTGAFLLMNTGRVPPQSRNRLLGTIAHRLGGTTDYALEGSIFMAGAVIDWLKTAGLVSQPHEAAEIAAAANPASRVYLVPAFVGLGAPYWQADARGALVGMTRDSGRAELVAAALDSVAFQTRDILEAMRKDSGGAIRLMRVDGGMTVSDAFLQRLADLTGVETLRASTTETTAQGAAYLAGLGSGLYQDLRAVAALWRRDKGFAPKLTEAERDARYAGWLAAVRRVL